MKDILKVMSFDFLTAKPIALGIFIVAIFIAFIAGQFFSPFVNLYIIFAAMLFVIPLHSAADKYGFNKLYGILPVKRKNITRARFLYIYLTHFFTSVLSLLMVYTARAMKLYRLLPDQSSPMVQMIRDGFMDTNMLFAFFVGAFIFFTLLFSYIEMTGQIFGRENEMKIIMITLIAIVVVMAAFFSLSDKGIIPRIQIPEMPGTESGRAAFTACSFAGVLIISVIFGEITANTLAKREL